MLRKVHAVTRSRPAMTYAPRVCPWTTGNRTVRAVGGTQMEMPTPGPINDASCARHQSHVSVLHAVAYAETVLAGTSSTSLSSAYAFSRSSLMMIASKKSFFSMYASSDRAFLRRIWIFCRAGAAGRTAASGANQTAESRPGLTPREHANRAASEA